MLAFLDVEHDVADAEVTLLLRRLREMGCLVPGHPGRLTRYVRAEYGEGAGRRISRTRVYLLRADGVDRARRTARSLDVHPSPPEKEPRTRGRLVRLL